MKMPRSFSKFLLGLFVAQMIGQKGFAVDFKIDMPSDTGRIPSTLSTDETQPGFFDEDLGTSYGQDDTIGSTVEDDPRNTFRIDVPESPSVALPRNEKNNVQNSNTNANTQNATANVAKPKKSETTVRVADARKSLDKAFPSPVCLADNVAFWERVYSEVDENDAIIHDKDDLSRVFAIVKLPYSQRQRTLMVNEVKDHVQRKLRDLADSIGNPNSWDRTQKDLAQLFPGSKLNPATVRQSAESLRVQTGLKTRFEAGIQRSLKFLGSIHDIVQDANLPSDIVYLPHVESSYHPGARSKVGAVGLWQIMPGTMKLVMGKGFVHKRNEIDISTRAASRILKQNYATTGSWPLALTAYNHGLHGVMRAVKMTGSRDLCEIIDKYESRSFRFASSNFYAQFLAARNVAQGRYLQLSKREGPKTVLRELLTTAQKGKL